ncbi:unnamed protein product [Natator depressus]
MQAQAPAPAPLPPGFAAPERSGAGPWLSPAPIRQGGCCRRRSPWWAPQPWLWRLGNARQPPAEAQPRSSARSPGLPVTPAAHAAPGGELPETAEEGKKPQYSRCGVSTCGHGSRPASRSRRREIVSVLSSFYWNWAAPVTYTEFSFCVHHREALPDLIVFMHIRFFFSLQHPVIAFSGQITSDTPGSELFSLCSSSPPSPCSHALMASCDVAKLRGYTSGN